MIKFGTGGWRAIIGEEFTKENIQILGQAIANLVKEGKFAKGPWVIGYDRRFLSDRGAHWLIEVLAGNGIKCFLIEKVGPTPLIMYAVMSLKTPFGATITASHNPAEYNGIKIFTEGGRDASETVTQQIEGAANQLDPSKICRLDYEAALKSGIVEIIDPFNEYIDAILKMINVEAIKDRKLKIVVDPMFGVSKTSLLAILITARCEVEIINDRHDTLFGGRLPSPNSNTLQRLKNLVVEKGYDLGIGTDGDADRLGIIDEKGNFIHPNNILAVLYYYLLKYKGWKGGVVRNNSTTHLLDKIAAGFGEECYEVPVGFKHVSSKMEEKNALIGGESSGGLTIRGHIKGKDGIFAASILIELLSVTKKSLSGLMEEINQQFGYFHMAENDFKFAKSDKPRLVKKLFEDKELPAFKYPVDHVSYLDGVKVYFKNGGWIIARFSGTEPLLRIFAEMGDETKAHEVSDMFKTFLNI